MTIINDNAPRKGLEIGSIRIFERNTKFEVDVRGLNSFAGCFRNVSFNGLPFTVTEVKDRYGRNNGRKRNTTANNRWRKSEGGGRARFGEKKRGAVGKKRKK